MEPSTLARLLPYVKNTAQRLRLVLNGQNLAALPPEIKELARNLVIEIMADNPSLVAWRADDLQEGITETLFATAPATDGGNRIYLCHHTKKDRDARKLHLPFRSTFLDVLGIKESLGLDLMPDIERLVKAFIDGPEEPEEKSWFDHWLLKAMLEIGRRSADPAFAKLTRDHAYRTALLAEQPKWALELVFGPADRTTSETIFDRTERELHTGGWTDGEIASTFLGWLAKHAATINLDNNYRGTHLCDAVAMLSTKCFGHRHDRRMDQNDWFDKRSAAVANTNLHVLGWNWIKSASPPSRASRIKTYMALHAMVVGEHGRFWNAHAETELETLMSHGQIKMFFEIWGALEAASHANHVAILGDECAGRPDAIQKTALPFVLIGFCKAFSDGRFGIAAAISQKFRAAFFDRFDRFGGAIFMNCSGTTLEKFLSKALAILGDEWSPNWAELERRDALFDAKENAVKRIRERVQVALELATRLGQTIALDDEII